MAQVDKSDETILSETLSAHRRQNIRFHNVSTIIISIFMLIGSIGLGCCIYYTVISTPKPPSSYEIGIGLSSVVILTSAFCLCMCLYTRRSTFRELKMISINKTKPLIWRLHGNQWIKYLECIYGPDQEPGRGDRLSLCCNHKTFNRLKERNYGHIVFTENAIFIDELFYYNFSDKIFIHVALLKFDNQQLLIRFYFMPSQIMVPGNSTKYEIMDKFRRIVTKVDIFVPDTLIERRQRLDQMIYLLNAQPIDTRKKIINLNQIRILFQENNISIPFQQF